MNLSIIVISVEVIIIIVLVVMTIKGYRDLRRLPSLKPDEKEIVEEFKRRFPPKG